MQIPTIFVRFKMLGTARGFFCFGEMNNSRLCGPLALLRADVRDHVSLANFLYVFFQIGLRNVTRKFSKAVHTLLILVSESDKTARYTT